MAMKLRYQEDSVITETMATDSVYLYYNSEFVLKLTEPELIGVICHEVLHVALGHTFRKGMRDHMLWNIACDYAVNAIIHESGIKLPQPHLYNDKYKDMAAELIYDDIYNQTQKNPSLMNGLLSGQLGDVNPYKGSSNQVEEQERQVKLNVSIAAQTAKERESLSNPLKRLVDELQNPKLPWREILSRFLTEKALDDYSWSKPNKRYLYSGLYLPSLDGLKMKTIAIAIDTSGSIDHKQFMDFISEVKQVLAVSPGTEAEVMYVDYKLCGTDRLTSTSDDLTPIGGGGTDYRPAFEHIAGMDEELSCLIYFTDGWCKSFPAEQPELPVLWILSEHNTTFSPPWGEIIFID